MLTKEEVEALRFILDEAEAHLDDRSSGVEEGIYDPEENPMEELWAQFMVASGAVQKLIVAQYHEEHKEE
jgi:hypothetical protein